MFCQLNTDTYFLSYIQLSLIHICAGDAEGSMNAANILKPALSRGELQVIGATTFNEYRKSIEKDSALEPVSYTHLDVYKRQNIPP